MIAKKPTLHLDNQARRIILRGLKIKRIEDIVDKDFPSSGIIDRQKVKLYLRRIGHSMRLSVRLRMGLFYTPSEWRERIQQIKSLRLP